MKPSAYLPLLAVVICGCPKASSVPTQPAMESNEAMETGPSIRPLEKEAATLRKLLGYEDAIAYEFRGTWLKCWLECEVDGKLVASTPEHAVSPKWFSSDSKVNADDAGKVIGWITIWGEPWDELHLQVRGELPREDGRISYALPLVESLKIPEIPDEVRKQGTNKVGTMLEVGWAKPDRSLPGVADQPVALQSYSWTEKTRRDWSKAPDPHQPDPNQRILREVKVTLYCAVPDDAISPTAASEQIEQQAQ